MKKLIFLCGIVCTAVNVQGMTAERAYLESIRQTYGAPLAAARHQCRGRPHAWMVKVIDDLYKQGFGKKPRQIDKRTNETVLAWLFANKPEAVNAVVNRTFALTGAAPAEMDTSTPGDRSTMPIEQTALTDEELAEDKEGWNFGS